MFDDSWSGYALLGVVLGLVGVCLRSLSLVRGGMGESSGGAELRPTGKQRSPRRVTESGVTGVAERKTVFSDRLSENTNDAGQSRQNGACRKEKRGAACFRRFTEQPGQYDRAEES